jgi:hypothetical protein
MQGIFVVEVAHASLRDAPKRCGLELLNGASGLGTSVDEGRFRNFPSPNLLSLLAAIDAKFFSLETGFMSALGDFTSVGALDALDSAAFASPNCLRTDIGDRWAGGGLGGFKALFGGVADDAGGLMGGGPVGGGPDGGGPTGGNFCTGEAADKLLD